MKSDVEKDLPDRQEIVIDVEMTLVQKRLYKAIYEKNTEFLFRKASVPSLMNVGMQLRKCCNHPYLIKGVEDEHTPDDVSLSDDAKMALLVSASGKFVLLDKLLPKLRQEGHRVLIFSQMVRMLDIIEDYLNQRRFTYERIDGNIRGSERQQAIDHFTNDPDIFVFMLATRAGGVGINLTAADTVIIFDSDWNPQNDLQAQARCHRIGQTQHVKVYRLITKNTYEQAMFNRASLKLGLDQAVLHPMTTSTKGNAEKLSKKDIENLLKHGAYSIVEDKSDERSKEFCEKDIDDILASNSRLIQYSSNPTMAGSSFAKASFVIASQNGEEPLDIDDPNFWEKVGFHYERTEKENELIVNDSRKRRRVQRFTEYSGLDGNRDGKKNVVGADKDDAPFSLDESDETPTSDDQDAETTVVEKKAEIRRESLPEEIVAPGDWSASDRERFVQHLVAFGYDRWTPIRARIHAEETRPAAPPPHTPILTRTTDDLRLAALCLIATCVACDSATPTAAGVPAPTPAAQSVAVTAAPRRTAPSPIRNLLTFPTIAHDLQNVLKSQGTEWEAPAKAMKPGDLRVQMEAGFALLRLLPSFGEDPKYSSLIKKQFRPFLCSLERAFVLGFSVEQVCGPDMNFALLAECAHFKLNAAIPDSSWTMADDAALLKGAYTYGQGDFYSINQGPDSCLYGRLKYLGGLGQDGVTPARPLPDRYPTLKSLMGRQRALLTNLSKQVFKLTSRSAASAPARPPPVVPPPPVELAPMKETAKMTSPKPVAVPAPQQSTMDPAAAASQALQAGPPLATPSPASASSAHPTAQFAAGYDAYVGAAVAAAAAATDTFFAQRASQSAFVPLQFVAEYRSLSVTAEELLQSFPNHLMEVLHKSHYLNIEFETKESEARNLATGFPALKGPVDALGDNARDLSILFRRVRRRSNKILHIQQLMSQWGQNNGFGADPARIPADAAVPAELAGKRKAGADLFLRITECLEAVTRLTNRNRLILSRLEHLASSRD